MRRRASPGFFPPLSVFCVRGLPVLFWGASVCSAGGLSCVYGSWFRRSSSCPEPETDGSLASAWVGGLLMSFLMINDDINTRQGRTAPPAKFRKIPCATPACAYLISPDSQRTQCGIILMTWRRAAGAAAENFAACVSDSLQLALLIFPFIRHCKHAKAKSPFLRRVKRFRYGPTELEMKGSC